MSNDLLITLFSIALGVAIIIYFLNKKLQQQKPSDEMLEIMKLLQDGSQKDRKVLLETLQNNTQSLNERLDNAARVIGNLQRNVGEMSEIGRSMKDLQDFLRSPKLRGNVGEQVLKELLGQMLPKQSFHLQYGFKNGTTVDAAIKTTGGIIPVDSKFPMENFRKINSATSEVEKKEAKKEFVRDVKKHIDDIAKKYILTDEGTIDYALMYIPSESIFYEVVNDADLFDYAGRMRVLPVSPMTFYAYMKAILMSFEGQKIEARAKEILQAIRSIQKDYEKVDDGLNVLGKHLTNAYNMMTQVTTTFMQLGNKINATHAISDEVKEEVKIKA